VLQDAFCTVAPRVETTSHTFGDTNFVEMYQILGHSASLTDFIVRTATACGMKAPDDMPVKTNRRMSAPMMRLINPRTMACLTYLESRQTRRYEADWRVEAPQKHIEFGHVSSGVKTETLTGWMREFFQKCSRRLTHDEVVSGDRSTAVSLQR